MARNTDHDRAACFCARARLAWRALYQSGLANRSLVDLDIGDECDADAGFINDKRLEVLHGEADMVEPRSLVGACAAAALVNRNCMPGISSTGRFRARPLWRLAPGDIGFRCSLWIGIDWFLLSRRRLARSSGVHPSVSQIHQADRRSRHHDRDRGAGDGAAARPGRRVRGCGGGFRVDRGVVGQYLGHRRRVEGCRAAILTEKRQPWAHPAMFMRSQASRCLSPSLLMTWQRVLVWESIQ